MTKISRKVKIATFVFAVVLFFIVGKALAADLIIIPSGATLGLNQTLTVDVKINSGDTSINAAQGVLKFDPTILQVKSISKTNSIFNFWLSEPNFSNTDGKIQFLGGTPDGVAGGALQVLRIVFTTSGVGSGDLTFMDSSITAADGSGKNIVANKSGAVFVVSSQGGGAPGKTPAPTTGSVPSGVIPTPEQIIRTPAPATGSPSIPELKVTVYSDPTQWFNYDAPFTASWVLPADVSGVSTLLNQSPRTDAPTISQGLFASKTFQALQGDGVYYLHVRFQNGKGWGPSVHYRLAMDTQPPLPFQISLLTGGLVSNDPAPTLSFNTGDSLSGIAKYAILVNSENIIYTDKDKYQFTPHAPGDYNVIVKAVDQAGNIIENKVKLEIVPIEDPVITFITNKVFGTDTLRIKGSARVGYKVEVTIETKNKSLVSQSEVSVDTSGQWSYQLERTLNPGDYFVTVVAKDSQGALSLPVGPQEISVKETPIISLFGLDITLKLLIIILVVGGILTAAWFYWKTLLHLARFQRESTIIGRDLRNAFDMVKKDLDEAVRIVKKDISIDKREFEFKAVSKKIKATLDKIDGYLDKDLEKLK